METGWGQARYCSLQAIARYSLTSVSSKLKVHIVDEDADELSGSSSYFADEIFKIYLLNYCTIGPNFNFIACARSTKFEEEAS